MKFTPANKWIPQYCVGDVLRKEIGVITITEVDQRLCFYRVRITESPTHADHDTCLTEYFIDDMPEAAR